MNSTEPKLFSTIVPGGINMEEWAEGGFSKFLHPEKDCTDEVNVAIDTLKNSLLSLIDDLVSIDNVDEFNTLQAYIKNYNPKN